MKNEFPSMRPTKTLGIKFPIVQAPVSPFVIPKLATAVSNAGAVGRLPLTWSP